MPPTDQYALLDALLNAAKQIGGWRPTMADTNPTTVSVTFTRERPATSTAEH